MEEQRNIILGLNAEKLGYLKNYQVIPTFGGSRIIFSFENLLFSMFATKNVTEELSSLNVCGAT